MPKPILPPELASELAPATLLVRGGSERSAYEETSEALFMTSGFVYGSAAEAEAEFQQDRSRYVYSRYRNPTVTMFEERLRLIEGAQACRATASGMAAGVAAPLVGGPPRQPRRGAPQGAAWGRYSRPCRARSAPVSGSCAAALCLARATISWPSCCRATASKRCWSMGATSRPGRTRWRRERRRCSAKARPTRRW